MSAVNLRSMSFFKGMIVRIDVELLPSSVIIIPLVTEEDRRKHINSNHAGQKESRFYRFSSNFNEVLLEGYIPPYCYPSKNNP